MRKRRLLLCMLVSSALILPATGFSQDTRFDSLGKLTFLHFESGYSKRPFFIVDQYYRSLKDEAANNKFYAVTRTSNRDTINKKVLEPLKKFDLNQKTAYSRLLSACIEDAIKALKDEDKNLRPFIDSLWAGNDRLNYIADLEQFKKVLDSGNIGAYSSPSYLRNIKSTLAATLFDTSSNSFSVGEFTDSKFELWRKNVFNEFVIRYYDSTYTTAPDGLKKLNLYEITTNTKRLDYFARKADSLLMLVYNNNGKMEMEHLAAMQAFIEELNKPDPGFRLEKRVRTFEQMKELFRNDWFKQWLWFKKGALMINPLGFTTEDFYNSGDKSKELTDMSNRYVDSLLARHLRSDSTANVARYDQLLLQKGKAKERLNASDGLTSKIKENTVKKNELLFTKNLVNKVEIPEKGMFLNFSTTKEFKTSANEIFEKKYKHVSLHGDDQKIIALHNIPKGYAGKLIEENKVIPLESGFTRGLGQFTGYAAQVLEFVPKFTPYASMLINTRPQIKSIVQPSANLQNLIGARGERINPDRQFKYKDTLRNYIKASPFYNESAFQGTLMKIIASNNDSTVLDTIISIRKMANYSYTIETLNNYINEYEIELERIKNRVLWEIRKDSLLLTGMYNVFSEATLLPTPLKGKDDDNPSYFTSILSTTATEDSSIEKTVTPIAFAKDTLSAQSFKYKMGKSVHWQLGAGIAYTATNFTQTRAKEESGQIKIENTSQAFRFIVGMHYHFGKGLFVHDDRFGGRFNERSSVYLGVGIPKPLENIYFGYSYDLVPGLKLTTGLHFYRNDKYTILNNSITEKKIRYNIAFPFFAVQIDPNSLLKTLDIINKN